MYNHPDWASSAFYLELKTIVFSFRFLQEKRIPKLFSAGLEIAEHLFRTLLLTVFLYFDQLQNFRSLQ
jgi:hypothetical protein